MSSSYREELNRWLSQLDVKANTVLDIGGSQLPVKGRTKSWEVEKYLIADLPEPHVDSPKPDIEIDLNNYSIGDLDLTTDLIFCLEVFDYVYNPITALGAISSILKPGGIAWVTFPMHYPLHQPVDDDALRYMPGGIIKLAKMTNLEIVKIIPRRTETDAIYNAFRAERMRCAKNIDHNVSGWIVEFKR